MMLQPCHTVMRKTTIIVVIFFIVSACTKNKSTTEYTNKNQTDTIKKTIPKAKSANVILAAEGIQKQYFLGDIEVQVYQIKGDGKDFYCKSRLIIIKKGILLDSISFIPEPVGGSYGISEGIEVNNHLIFTKQGDYDGRTLIINKQGKLFNIIGGRNYVDKETGLLFSIYTSDLSGIAVFDLNSDSVLVTINEKSERPLTIHKYSGSYYASCIDEQNDQSSIWKFEFDGYNMIEVSSDKTQVNSVNELPSLPSLKKNCGCEE